MVSLCLFKQMDPVHSGFHSDNFSKQPPDPRGVGKEQENVMPELKQRLTHTVCLSADELQATSLIVFTCD